MHMIPITKNSQVFATNLLIINKGGGGDYLFYICFYNSQYLKLPQKHIFLISQCQELIK